MTESASPCQSVQIADRTISADDAPYLIAEMSCAHQGSVDEALALVDAAANAQADAVQFEIFDTDDNITPDFPNAELIRNLQLNAEQWNGVFQRARDKNIPVIAYVYDFASFELAEKLKPDAYKLNSSDLSNTLLLEALAGTGLPFTLGTGASNLQEIEESLRYLLERGGNKFVLMHGVQSFPTRIEDANINRLAILREKFGALVGYADHTDTASEFAPLADLIALGAGAVILEKHICTRRSSDRIDTQSALEPKEFASYIQRLRSMAPALGDRIVKPFTEVEEKYRRFQKKTAVACDTIKKGQELKPQHIVYLRHPECGISPMRAQAMIGLRSNREISAGAALQEGDFG